MEGEPGAPRGTALRKQLLIGAVLALSSLVLAGVLNFHAVREARATRQELLVSQDILKATNDLRFLYAQTLADLRAYLLTGVIQYRQNFDGGIVRLYEQLHDLQPRLAHDPRQRQALDELEQEFKLRESQFARALEAYRTGGTPAIAPLSSDPSITRSSTYVPELLDGVRAHERAKFDTLQESDRRRQDQLARWIAAFFGLAVLIALWLMFQLRRELRARSAAEKLVEWERRFADVIIENLPVMLYIKDAATLKLIRVNRAVEKLTGRPREDMLDKTDSQFFPPHIADAYMANERRFVDEYHGEMVEEVPIETTTGRRILSVRKVVINDERGKPAFLIGTSIDISERLESERRLRQYSNELAEKTRALESANRELESFSYSVSHDLRSPLRAVDGYAAILEEDYADRFDDEGRRYLKAVRDGAGRMGTLIQDLLTFSRLGRHELVRRTVSTRELVDTAWQQVLSSTPGLKAQLAVGELPQSVGDPRLLTQVWTNLLDNAAKYSSKTDEPIVKVAGRVEGDEAVFCVEDNGAGFDMRYYDKLFQVFQRLHRDVEYAGTGVGLAIVHRIIARHGGRVWAESSPGRGARFSFALPTP